MEVGDQRHAPAALPPGKGHGTQYIGGCVGLRTGLDGCVKSRPPPGFDPRIVQPVARRYTDCAIPANIMCGVKLQLHSFLTSALVGGKWTVHGETAPRAIGRDLDGPQSRPGQFGEEEVLLPFP
jgi:hypothetical protein